MKTDVLITLRTELAAAGASLKTCTATCKAFKAFKSSPQGLAFCAAQLHQAAGILRNAADHIIELAESIQAGMHDMPEQLELQEFEINGRE